MPEFVTLLTDYESANLKGWLASKKYDGLRCVWTGGNTKLRNANKEHWPATGLWSRYGNPIVAPDWFTENLPQGYILDGELSAGMLQKTKKLKTKVPNEAIWKQAVFHVFDIISPSTFFEHRRINNTHWKEFTVQPAWMYDHKFVPWLDRGFEHRLELLQSLEVPNTVSLTKLENTKHAFDLFETIIDDSDCDGLIVRNPKGIYENKRTKNIQRIKLVNEAFVKVLSVSHEPRSVVVDMNGIIFSIGSGLKLLPEVNSVVKINYAGLTDKGIPREARIKRN